MKRKSVAKENKSIKTFYLYAVVVFFVIVCAFAIRIIFLIQQSKFDGQHHFTIAVLQQQNVKKIIAFSPQASSMASLAVKDAQVTSSSLGKKFGIAADSYLEGDRSFPVGGDITAILWYAALHPTMVKTDMTFVDIWRLLILSKNITPNDTIVADIDIGQQSAENNTIIARALNDPLLVSESISVQIVNATDVSGVGQRLGKILTNMGVNVVEVSTSHAPQSKSKIQFFGGRSYTLEHLEKFLQFPVTELSRQPIANIVIILGEDSKHTNKF